MSDRPKPPHRPPPMPNPVDPEGGFTERDAIVSARITAAALGVAAPALAVALATSDAVLILIVILAGVLGLSFMWWAGIAEADARVKAAIRKARR